MLYRLLFFVSFTFFSLQLWGQAAGMTVYEYPLLENEHWWAGITMDGALMPFQEDYSVDLYGNDKGQQVQPLLLSSSGRYIWSDQPFAFTIDQEKIQITAAGAGITYSDAGSTLKDAFQLAKQNHFPSSGQLPHRALFEHPQYNTWIELNYDQTEENVLRYAQSILDNGFSPGVLMIDDNWQEDYGNWDFHPGRFQDPAGMVKKLHEMGFFVMLWVAPFVSPDSKIGRDLRKEDVFLKEYEQKRSAVRQWWNGMSYELDFTNPRAVGWFKAQLDHLQTAYGIDGFKFDAAQTDFYRNGIQSYRRITPNAHASLYGEIGLAYPLNEFRVMWKMAGQPLAIRLKDKAHNWEDLQKLIPQIISEGISGYPFTCPDMIGGGLLASFRDLDKIDQDLVVRSAQCSALMPMMQFSAAPWRVLDATHLAACKKAVEVREKSTPLIMALAGEAAKTGDPIIRAMEYEFPRAGFAQIRDQFMLGERLMVAPVVEPGQHTRQVHIPAGEWRADDGSRIAGPKVITIEVPLDRLPYFEKL
ncbi:MAG: glycoside hydrolase family 31 protein [Saprospiraceae bacterium]|nr:alpha-galactosidase [Lewinella sp.]